jgi:hypothetical protein
MKWTLLCCPVVTYNMYVNSSRTTYETVYNNTFVIHYRKLMKLKIIAIKSNFKKKTNSYYFISGSSCWE